MSPFDATDEKRLWSLNLGLLPITLYGSRDESGRRWVMLNGSRGNFVLDAEGEHDDPRSIAWSANVGHYVLTNPDVVEVVRWDKQSSVVERFSRAQVTDKLERFHQYLEASSPRQDASVVSHVVRTFRSLRAALGSEADGTVALSALLALFASSATDGLSPDQLDADQWLLSASGLAAADRLGSDTWALLLEDLAQGRPRDELRLDLNLMLRHAAGTVFQEAHYEAVFVPTNQLDLGLLPPRPVRTSGQTDAIGLHFTPPSLARSLVEESLRVSNFTEPVEVFDPACGSGEFLREALRQLRELDYQGPIRLVGWDLSPAACAIASFILNWESRATGGVTVDIQNRDALAHEWPRSSLLIMNPPFLAWEDMSSELRGRVSELLAHAGSGRPDLASAFLWLASQRIPTGGVVGAILPASLLSSESAGPVRGAIREVLSPVLVARLGSHMLFPGATVDTALFVGREAAVSEPTAVWSDHRSESTSAALRGLRRVRRAGDSLLNPVNGEGFSIYRAVGLSEAKSWAPRPLLAWELLRAASRRGFPRVADLFHVHQGARTGLNAAFVLLKSDWERLPHRERSYFRPAVLNGSIRDGVLSDERYVFFPYGQKEITTETALREKLPRYFDQYLKPRKQRLVARRETRIKWWQLIRERAWQIEPLPKLVSTYFGDSGSFAFDPIGNFAVVQGFAWLPKGSLRQQDLSEGVAACYVAILNSSYFSQLLSAVSNNVAGGQWDLSSRFIDDLPLPDFFGSGAASAAVLAEYGRQISQTGISSLSAGQRADYERVVASVYRIA